MDFKKLLSGGWDSLKDWAYKFFGSLVMEEKASGKMGLSLGRVLLLGVMGGMAAIWWSAFQGVSIDVGEVVKSLPESENAVEAATAVVEAMKGAPKPSMPDGMMEVFYALSGYVFGTKFTDALKKKWSK